MDADLRNSLRTTPIVDLEPTPALTVSLEATVDEACARMREVHSGCILAVNDDGTMAGIFTERDLVRKVLGPGKPMTTRIADVMTASPKSLKRTDTAAKALAMFVEGGFRHLPVVGDDARPVGVFSVKRMIRYLAETCPEAVYCIKPDPEHISTELYSG